jgi:hypothetical protein
MMGGAAATMGGMAMLAAAGPFMAGLGVGAALVGGACLARQVMKRRTSWRDDALDRGADAAMMPDEGETRPAGTLG